MLDIRDHGGIFGGGKKSTLFLPKSPNAGQFLFRTLEDLSSIQSSNGNYYVFSVDSGKLVRKEFNKDGTLLATIDTTPPKPIWESNSTVYIKNKNIMIYAFEGGIYYILKFDKNLNLLQIFTTSYEAISVSVFQDINENGWIAGINTYRNLIIYNQNGTEVARFPNYTFYYGAYPVWLNDDLLLACRNDYGYYSLCSVSSSEVSPSISMNSRFGVVFKKLVDMMQLKTV